MGPILGVTLTARCRADAVDGASKEGKWENATRPDQPHMQAVFIRMAPGRSTAHLLRTIFCSPTVIVAYGNEAQHYN